jgi:hypothetical protein
VVAEKRRWRGAISPGPIPGTNAKAKAKANAKANLPRQTSQSQPTKASQPKAN